MSKALKKLIDINRLREFKNKLVGAGSAYVQTSAVDQTVAGTKTFSKPIVGSVTGNAASATKLQTARTINGTSFNGTANITTANWGTARNITITDGTNTSTAVSVNGSANVALKLPATIKANLTGNCSGSSGSCTGNSATATKATQDSDGAQINTTYSKNGHFHSNVRTSDNKHTISFDWASQASGFVGITVDSIKQGGIVTNITLGEIGAYGIGSTVLAITGTWIDYGEITAGSGLKYAALDRNGGIYDLDTSIGATGTWIKVSGNSGGTGGFGLYRRIA